MSGLGLQALGIEWGTYVLVAGIFLLLLTGLPLAFVTGLVALIFTVGWFGPNAIPLVISRVYGFVTEYSLVAVPMFVFMASLLDRSGIAKDLFGGMRVLAGRMPGGVAVQTLVVAFVLATCRGSSAARSSCSASWRCRRCCASATIATSRSASSAPADHSAR